MADDIKKAFAALTGAKRVLLLPSLYPTREELAALMLLALTLEHNEKRVVAVIPQEYKDHFSQDLLWPTGAQTELEGTDELVITVDCGRSPVASLRYEQDGSYLHIYLRPDGTAPRPEDFTVNTRQAERFDAIVVIGAPRLELLCERRSLEPLVTQTTLINIDADPQNEGFGDHNLFAPRGELGETVTALITHFPAATPNATLWHSELFPSAPSLPALRFAGRMLARLEQQAGVLFSLASTEDFTRSGLEPDAFKAALPHLAFFFRRALFPQSYAVFWPQNAAFKGLIMTPEKQRYALIKERLPGRYTPDGYISAIRTDNADETRERVREAFRVT